MLRRRSRSHADKFALKEWNSLLDLKACAEVLETKRFSQDIVPLRMECPDGKRVLVIAPHPDDDTFGPGGTVMKAIARGAEVKTLYATDGHDDADRAGLIKQEAVSVCSAIGAVPVFLGCGTRRIPLTDREMNRKVVSLVREFDPEVVFVPFLLDDHDDHRRVNHLLLTVAQDFEHTNVEVWAYQVYSTVVPNVVVDITELAARKRDLIGMWKSVSGNRDWAHYVLGMNAANCRYLPSRDPVYVESFFVVPMEEYIDICRIYFSHPASEVYRSPFYRQGG